MESMMSIWKTILVTAYTWYLLYLPKTISMKGLS